MKKSLPPPTNTTSRWCSPGCATSSTRRLRAQASCEKEVEGNEGGRHDACAPRRPRRDAGTGCFIRVSLLAHRISEPGEVVRGPSFDLDRNHFRRRVTVKLLHSVL